MTDLRPCPFCGGDEVIHFEQYGYWFVFCPRCRANIGNNTFDGAAAAWNRRAVETCEMGCQPDYIEISCDLWTCSACDWAGHLVTEPKFCPNCGRKVER